MNIPTHRIRKELSFFGPRSLGIPTNLVAQRFLLYQHDSGNL